jgi:hypothetical protein
MTQGQSLVVVKSQEQVTYQVGAWGDDASRGNLGVSVEIQTHAYDSYPGAFDYFWVGDSLADGSFVQFGYGIEPGSYCLKGSTIGGKLTCLGPIEQILTSDARWQWQYWPNRENRDFYYQIGIAGSAGANGTWHEYGIIPDLAGSWAFELDGRIVANSNFQAQKSSDPEYLAAEKVTTPSSPVGNLGPVEFANLSYLTTSGWSPSSSLVSFNNCPLNSSCNQNLFGISSTSQNFTLAGSGVKGPTSGSLLWTTGYETLTIQGVQNAIFQVSFLSQQTTYQGNAVVSVPKGMYAYVTIAAPNVQTASPLGLIGGDDRFTGWTGDVHSNNLTAQVLMNSNKHIISVWATRLVIPTLVIVAAIGVASALVILGLLWRRKSLLSKSESTTS